MPEITLPTWAVPAGIVILAVLVIVLLLREQAHHKAHMRALIAQREALRDLKQDLSRLSALPTREEIYPMAEAYAARLEEGSQGQIALLGDRISHLSARMDEMSRVQESRIQNLTKTLDDRLARQELRQDQLREETRRSIDALRNENSHRLEEMRQTVDEKLHATLDKRLNESFSLVNQRLEEVYKGLGEMRSLASGVGDLKKVLTNVKARGIWGEAQLGAILQQTMAPGQYEENCPIVPGSRERVEYAVRLPGRDEDKVLLPIDAKFPLEDYQRLTGFREAGDSNAAASALSALESALKTEAKRIHDKYIQPPWSTDFAVMFLPVEGLYAEALHIPGLAEEMQEKYHVLPAGPTTLAALLTSLQVGFRTLAIEKRSGEVFRLLGAVKAEFSRYSELLDTARKRIQGVGDTLEAASKRTRIIENKLKSVEQLEGAGEYLTGAGAQDDSDPFPDDKQ